MHKNYKAKEINLEKIGQIANHFLKV